MDGAKAARIILIVEILSFFIQYTFGLAYNYSSIFDAITFGIAFLLSLCIKLDDYGDQWRKNCVLTIVILVIISSICNISTFGFGSIMTIGRFLLYFLLVNKINIDKTSKHTILLLGCTQLCLLQVVNLSSYNPNTVGLVYLTLGIVFALLLNPKDWFQKIFHLLTIVLIVSQMYLTGCRSCLMAYIFFLLMLLMPPIIWKRKLILIASTLALTIGSLAYTRLYVYWWEVSSIDSQLLSATAENTGKNFFSGRQGIWQESLSLLHDDVFWGTGSKIQLHSFDSVNIHNTILNFFLIYGSIVGVLVIYLINRTVYELRPYAGNKKVHDCISAYFAFLIVSVFETNLLVFSFMSLFPLMRAHTTIKEKPQVPKT